jgi:phage terminase large subunit
MCDLINEYHLNFDIQASKIIHRVTKTNINFRGFREQGRFNIQGMEGVDVLHIDEAQAITKQTLDVLIPTIRKEKAKIFFTMNRHVPNDPVYAKFVGRDDCLHININYNENIFCTDALKKEARECLKISQADYDHIWLGQPLYKTEDSVFSFNELNETKINKHPLADGYGIRLMGFDVARYGDDKCAAVGIQQMGALHWEVFHVDQWDHKDLNYTTGRILMTANEHDIEKSIIDEDGIGAGPLDTLNKGRGDDRFLGFRNPPISYEKNKFYANNRTANTYKLKEMVLKGHISIPHDGLIEELTTMKYTYDNRQRRILISKDKMRKLGVKSPNMADALIMAVSMIGEFDYKETRRYFSQSAYTKVEDPFKLIGIR